MRSLRLAHALDFYYIVSRLRGTVNAQLSPLVGEIKRHPEVEVLLVIGMTALGNGGNRGLDSRGRELGPLLDIRLPVSELLGFRRWAGPLPKV
jgi:hypothetical protein